MTISFREIADTVDGFDDEAEALNDTRKEFWAGVREQVSPHDVKALKEAIRIRRKRRKDPDATEAHDQRVSDILSEIDVDKSDQEEHARAPASRETDALERAALISKIRGEIIQTETDADKNSAEGRAAGCNDASVASPPVQESTERPFNRDQSTDDKASSAAAPQGEAAHVGTDCEMLADRKGHHATPSGAETGRDVGTVPPISTHDDFPDMPAFLDRRTAA